MEGHSRLGRRGVAWREVAGGGRGAHSAWYQMRGGEAFADVALAQACYIRDLRRAAAVLCSEAVALQPS